MILVCESLPQFKLLENIEQAQELFAQNDISTNDPEYKEFFELIKNDPDYAGKFAQWVFQGINFNDLKQTFNVQKEKNLKLDKDINNFQSFREYQFQVQKKHREKNTIEEKPPQNIVSPDTKLKQEPPRTLDIYAQQDDNNYSDDDMNSRMFSVDEKSLGIKRLEKGFYCLTDLYQTDDLKKPGQGLYIWTEIKYLKEDPKKGNIPLKFGQYGSQGEAKTPLQTIKSYRGVTMDGTVIIYAKRLDEYLSSESNKGFKHAYDAEHAVQKKIREKGGFRGTVGKSTEVFGGVSFEKLKEIISGVLYDSEKPKSYDMRPEQKEAHDKIVNYFEKGGKEFLLAAKMRFGKNFTLLNVAKTMGMKNILVLTYKPHVFDSLEQDIKGHVNFDGWKIVDFKKERNLEESKEAPTVFMSSAQLALHENENINIFGYEEEEGIETEVIQDMARNIRKLAKINFDMVIADEYHYGGSTFRFKKLLEALKYKYMVYVSGTAMKDIAMGRFDDDQIYSWSYIDEQQKKREEKDKGYGTHLQMPTMHFHLMEISEEAKSRASFYTPEEGFTMRKMLATEGGKLKDEGSMEILLRQIAGEGVHKTMSPYRSVANLDHTFWVLDKDVKGIKAMAKLMEKMPEYEDYIIIPATSNVVTNIKDVQEKINKAKNEGQRTITLSCYRFKEGVTVPEWNGVLMLDSGKSIEEYLQAIFRCQNPDVQNNKQECHVFDFNPQRCLSMVYESCENMDKTGSKKLSETITEFLDYAPILDHRDNKLTEVNFDNVIENFRVYGSFSEKFANIKNFNPEKIDDDVIGSLLGLIVGKRGKEIELNDQEIELGKNIKRSFKTAAKSTDANVDLTKGDRNLIKKTIEKISGVLSAIPLFLFNSAAEEETIDDIIYTDSPDLFEETTGINVDTLKMWVDKGLINKVLINRNIKYFLDEERDILRNASLEKVDEFVNQHFAIRAAEGSTPGKLVNEMLDKLPKDTWTDPKKTFCDPCMGTGKYILGIKERLMEGLKNSIPNEKEREKHIIEEMIWGVDIARGKTSIAKKLINNKGYKDNLLNKDSLNLDWNKMPKFDVVVGNPPFQKEVKREKGTNVSNAGAKIWHYFVEIGFSILNKNGIIAFITPDLWRTGPKKTIKEAQELIWNNNIIFFDSANNFFDVGGIVNIDYWIVSKNFNLDGVTIDPIFKKNKFLPISKNSQIKQFYKDIEKNDNFEMNVKSNSHYPNEIRKSEKGDENRKFPHVSTITQYMKNLYDWYEYKTEGFDHPKVITSTTISKNLNSFYDPGKVGTGHSSVGYLVKDKNEGDQLVNFLNNSKIIKMIEKETQNEKGFTGFPLQLIKRIPKSWVERFNDGEDL